MLDKRQRDGVMELFARGIKVSEIARRVGISRQSVYTVIRDDFEVDPELRALRKELKKNELQKKIRELKEPFETEKELTKLGKALDSLICTVLLMRFEPTAFTSTRVEVEFCPYCGEKLEYYEQTKPEKKGIPAYRCNKCGKNFPLS